MFLELAIDGELRANNLAEIAVDAFPDLGHQRWMVPLFIELRGLLKDLVGAEFNAEPAAFAAVLDDMQFSNGDGVCFGV